MTVNLDAMELGKGRQNPPEKSDIADRCHQWLEAEGVEIGTHPRYNRADLVAHRDDLGTYIIEVEGDSSRQREQAIYSALGQTILQMDQASDRLRYGLAVPDSPKWEEQLLKIPLHVREILGLQLYLVAETGVRSL